MTRTWEDNAAEFAALDQGEGWPFAVLVACSVEKTAAGRPGIVSVETIKVSARAFAEVAGTSPARVLRYLEAWNRAADNNKVIPSSELEPGDALKIDTPDIPFKTFYSVPDNAGGRTMGNVKTAVDTIEKRGAEAIVRALTPEVRAELTREVIKQADPVMMHEVRETVRSVEPVTPVADLSEQRREAEKRAEDRRKSAHSIRYLEVDGALEDAYKKVRYALREAQGVNFTEEERADMTETADRTTAALGMFRALITGTTGANWDAELTKLLAH